MATSEEIEMLVETDAFGEVLSEFVTLEVIEIRRHAEHLANKYPLDRGIGEMVRWLSDRLEGARAPAPLERREE